MKKLIKNITNIQTGLFAKPKGEGDVIYLQVKHFDEQGNLQSPLHGDLLSASISEKHLLKVGDVLFAAKGSKNFATVYENHNPTAVASTSFFVLRLTDNNILPEFLSWFLNSFEIQKKLKAAAIGSSIPSISKSVLEELEIVIPKLQTQKSIVDLSQLRKKELELHQKIQHLKDIKIQKHIYNSLYNKQ